MVVDNCTSDGLGPCGHVAFVALGTLWLACQLDALIVFSYAANQSYRNPVELLFGWVSQRLAGNVINANLEMAKTDVKNLVDGKRDAYDAHGEIPTDNYPDFWPPYDSLPLVTRSSNKNIKSRADLKHIYDNYCFLVDHYDRRSNMLTCVRCSDKNRKCSLQGWRATQLRAQIDLLKGLPSPIPHSVHANHDMFLHEQQMAKVNVPGDTHQPSFQKKVEKRKYCHYVFKNDSDMAMHKRLRHPRSGALLNE